MLKWEANIEHSTFNAQLRLASRAGIESKTDAPAVRPYPKNFAFSAFFAV
jgi:hypothetical protein